jgi:hypothetical protein
MAYLRGNNMKKRRIGLSKKEKADIPQNIVVLVLMIAIIVSITGTWMVLDAVSGVSSQNPIQNRVVEATTQGNIALNIEYDEPKNQTKTGE